MNETKNSDLTKMLALMLEGAARALRDEGYAAAPTPRVANLKNASVEPTSRPAKTRAAYGLLYVAGTPGLVQWCEAANFGLKPAGTRYQGGGVTAYKVGLTMQPLFRRQEDLQADRYSSYRKVNGLYEEVAGFDRWEMQRISPIALTDDAEDLIDFEPRGVRFKLDGKSFEAIEEAFRAEMEPLRLDIWAKSPEGHAHLERANISPKAAQMWTAYRYDRTSPTKYKQASEIYKLQARRMLPLVIANLVKAIRPS